jgi:hypothetical protein
MESVNFVHEIYNRVFRKGRTSNGQMRIRHGAVALLREQLELEASNL